MVKKDITINDLVVMVQRGFEETTTKSELKSLEAKMDNRFDKVEGRLVKLEIKMDNLEAGVEEIRKH